MDGVDQTIEEKTRAISFMPEGHPDMPGQLNNLGVAYRDRFERLDYTADIDKAIEHLSHAVSLVPSDHPDLRIWLNNLGISYQSRFTRSRIARADDIGKAIECLTRALALTPEGHSHIPCLLNNLGNVHSCQFGQLRNIQDIDKAIGYNTRAVALTPEGHARMPTYLSNLGNAHRDRFKWLEMADDIDKAVEFHTCAVSLTPEGHPLMSTHLNNLGNSLQNRGKQLKRVEVIDKAIECHTRAVSLTPPGHPSIPIQLNNIGNAHTHRFELVGELGDINKAIECNTCALSFIPENHPEMPNLLNNLGTAHQLRFERLKEADDIDSAIEYKARGVSLAPEGHPDRPTWLKSLGDTHHCRFQKLGRIVDVNAAIDCMARALSLMGCTCTGLPSLLNNLGNAYCHRFERLGNVDDVDKAVGYLARAVSLSPESAPSLINCLNNLGNAHFCRYDRLGDLYDIDKAIECQTRAVLLIPEGHPDLPSCLDNLGSAYSYRFERLERPEDVEKAIEYKSRAVLLMTDDHAHMPSQLNNLGIVHLRRFQRLRQLDDIDRAVELQTRAVSLTPEGHLNTASQLGNLGAAHLSRYEAFKRLDDLDKAIEYLTQAVSLTSEDDSAMTNWLSNLGRSHRSRFHATCDMQSLSQSLECFRRSAQSSAGYPLAKFRAAHEWAQIAPLLPKPELEHLCGYQCAMGLVPEVIWLGESIGKRYENIQLMGDIALEAVAAAIDARQYALAIEWLEQGRSIVWNQIIQLRNPIDELSTTYPSLAETLRQIANRLHSAGSSPLHIPTRTSSAFENAAQMHRKLAGQYQRLLQEIRALPGFEGFLRSKKALELLPTSQTGPVVVVNVHEARCDALVLLPGHTDIGHVPLPDLTTTKVVDAHAQFQETLELHGLRDRSDSRRPVKPSRELRHDHFAEVFGMLWLTVAKPILGFLGYSLGPVDQLPHITWCTTGALSFLPLHAAGLYKQVGDKLVDFAVSSYTPTISALKLATLPSPVMHSRLLAIGQEATPGQGRLPGARSELKAIQQYAHMPLDCMCLEGSKATRAAVLEAMEQYDWVHFACHATQDVSSPTESGIFLHDGQLSLATITQKSFKNKGLAFLSACQTATGDKKVADEAVHLASGMLMAGYLSVIATMWSVKDADAPVIAQQVYGQLLKDGKMSYKDAARALHDAVGCLRAQVGENAFERWAPYIHIGC